MAQGRKGGRARGEARAHTGKRGHKERGEGENTHTRAHTKHGMGR